MSGTELRLGAVAYHPRIVTIWERFRTYFADAGVPTDYILFSNYERLVDAGSMGRSRSAGTRTLRLWRSIIAPQAGRGFSGCVTSIGTGRRCW